QAAEGGGNHAAVRAGHRPLRAGTRSRGGYRRGGHARRAGAGTAQQAHLRDALRDPELPRAPRLATRDRGDVATGGGELTMEGLVGRFIAAATLAAAMATAGATGVPGLPISNVDAEVADPEAMDREVQAALHEAAALRSLVAAAPEASGASPAPA